MWISAALAAVQLISGIATNSKKQAAKRLQEIGAKNALSPLAENVTRARGRANVTEAPGAAELEEANRQAAADQIGAATRVSSDSSKVSAVTTRAGINQTRGNRAIQTMTDKFRDNAENNLANANMAISQGQRAYSEKKDQVLMEAETAKSNLLGAGVNNLMTVAKDEKMMKFYSKLYGSEFTSMGSQLKGIFTK
jgi:hypothetical protein